MTSTFATPDLTWSADALIAYLGLVWHAAQQVPDHPEMQRLHRSLRAGPYYISVRVFDSTGRIAELSVRVDSRGFQVHHGAAAGKPDYLWVVSRRYLQDVLTRPRLYLQNPSRLDIGWLLS